MSAGVNVRAIDHPRLALGEGPLWEERSGRFHFVDRFGQKIHWWDPASGERGDTSYPAATASFGFRQGEGLVVALDTGLYLSGPDIDGLEFIGDPEAAQPLRSDYNDGKVDPAGRFLVVGANRPVEGAAARATLYSLEGCDIRTLDSPFYIGNGPTWSPDGTTFYLNDSLQQCMYAYDYDVATGAVANRRVFADLSELAGIPDGATVDEAGGVWMAFCEGSAIAHLSPAGEILEVIPMPTTHITSVAFGGPELDQLLVTSIDPAAIGHASEDDFGGALFLVTGLGVRGLPAGRFAA